MKSFIQSTTSRIKLAKSLSVTATESRPLLPLGSTKYSQSGVNGFVTTPESVLAFSGGWLTASVTGLPIGASARTMEAMLRFDTNPSSNNAGAVSYGGYANGQDFVLVPRGSEISDNIGMHYYSQNLNSTRNIANMGFGTWFHVCVTQQGTTQRIYLNGTLYATGSLTLNTGSSLFAIGRRISGGSEVLSNGYIREVRLWDKALTQEQINECVNTRFLGFIPSGLKFYAVMNETDATGVVDKVSGVAMTKAGTTITASTQNITYYQRFKSSILSS